MRKKYNIRYYQFALAIISVAIACIGVLLIGSAERSLMSKQALGVGIGVVIMVVFSIIDYNFILNFYWILYILNIILLVGVQLTGRITGGATRWINLGFFIFQPSELSKIILILFFARYLQAHQDDINVPRTLLSACGLLALPLLLIMIQPDLSTSIVVVLIFITLLFAARVSYKVFAGLIAVVVPLVTVFIINVLNGRLESIIGYQYYRVISWLRPKDWPDYALQQDNSISAIGSGQLFGKGLNNNLISSVKNGNFLSESQTDFIFAVAGEELGFIGTCTIILLLFLIVVECFYIARKANDMAGKLICCGIGAWIGFQAIINICVTIRLLPNTGLTLPFVSYGLTSLWTLFMSIGIILNIGLQRKTYK